MQRFDLRFKVLDTHETGGLCVNRTDEFFSSWVEVELVARRLRLGRRIARVVRHTKGIAQSRIGDVVTGYNLIERNSKCHFLPASKNDYYSGELRITSTNSVAVHSVSSA